MSEILWTGTTNYKIASAYQDVMDAIDRGNVYLIRKAFVRYVELLEQLKLHTDAHSND